MPIDFLSDLSPDIGIINKSKGNIAYNIIDIDGEISNELEKEIGSTEGIIKIRIL